MKDVPFIAGAHHEKLNGKGYPNGLTADQIPLQVRIMTLADIFEALTANDRPYMAEPKKMSLVLKILGFMVKDGELDPDLVDFFLTENMHMEYAQKHLKESQIDI
jgi:HD-GYP domain-containing protein (c-di-GMP phosphodiesterase class II)